jgi:hypothetical protein
MSKPKIVTVNLNHMARVKLTAHGVDQYYKHYARLGMMDNIGQPWMA